MRALFTTAVLALFAIPLHAQMVEVTDEANPPSQQQQAQPKNTNGQERAQGYMNDRKPAPRQQAAARAEDGGPAPRYLDVHIGGFFDSQGYKWGHGDQNHIGKFNAGIDYRLGEWVNSADFLLRVDFTSYSLDEGNARKLSVNAIVTFPDANSRFPLYFGAGIGPGFFIKQIPDQSVLALDYSILAGARFLNVIERLGFMVETGIKNHIHAFSYGQYNGIYVNVGTVWLF
jgi:opacity protein-like surface antigen